MAVPSELGAFSHGQIAAAARIGDRHLPDMSTIALIADVHGNLPALEAVVADIAAHGLSRVVNLGDHVSGPLWPGDGRWPSRLRRSSTIMRVSRQAEANGRPDWAVALRTGYTVTAE